MKRLFYFVLSLLTFVGCDNHENYGETTIFKATAYHVAALQLHNLQYTDGSVVDEVSSENYCLAITTLTDSMQHAVRVPKVEAVLESHYTNATRANLINIPYFVETVTGLKITANQTFMGFSQGEDITRLFHIVLSEPNLVINGNDYTSNVMAYPYPIGSWIEQNPLLSPVYYLGLSTPVQESYDNICFNVILKLDNAKELTSTTPLLSLY